MLNIVLAQLWRKHSVGFSNGGSISIEFLLVNTEKSILMWKR